VNIIEAAQAMRRGKVVRRDYNDEKYFSDIYKDLYAMRLNAEPVHASVDLDDLLAEDWEIVE